MHCRRIVNGIKNKNIKKQPWSNVECFAFGGEIVRFASLETCFHAANHTIPPPPSYEGLPLCPKDKNRSPFHGEKPLMKKLFLGRRQCQSLKTIRHSIGTCLWQDSNALIHYSLHWKHAEGMSLRYNRIEFRRN